MIQMECLCSAKKKRAIQLLLLPVLLLFTNIVFLYTFVPSFTSSPTLCLSSNHTQIYTSHSEIPSPALLRLPPFASASCLWRTIGVVIFLAFSPRPFSSSSVP